MSTELDVRKGVLAVKAGLITSEQLAEAIAEVKQLRQEGKEVELLQLLVRKGQLTEEQARHLAEAARGEGGERSRPGTIGMDRESSPVHKDAMIGEVLGDDFKIVKKLGSGGMGSVYLAEQMSLKRKVAVKVIAPHAAADSEYVARFKREAMSAAQLGHPNIIQVYTIGEHRGLWYIAMEYVEGQSAGDMLREQSPMDVSLAANIVTQALKGLARAHSTNVIHRDIKPDNLMLNASGEVKIADFGLARMTAQRDVSLTASGAVMGTPHYMSPQQAEGKELNQQADIYSLGASFYHMVTGSTPFEGDSAMSILYKAGTSKAEPARKRNPKVPVELSRLIEKMMARDLAVRYATCDDVLTDLNNLGYLGETPAQAKARKRRAIPIIAGVVVLIVLAAGIVLNRERIFGKAPAIPDAPKPQTIGPMREAKPVRPPEIKPTPVAEKKPSAPEPVTTPPVKAAISSSKPESKPPAPIEEKAAPDKRVETQPAAPQVTKVIRDKAVARDKPEPTPADDVKKRPAPEQKGAGTKPSPAPSADAIASLPRPAVKVPPAKRKPVKAMPEPPAPQHPIPAAKTLLPKLPQISPFPKAKKIITVKPTGGGDFKTLADAVAAIPSELKEPTRIDIYPGTYEGPIMIGGHGGTLSTGETTLQLQAVGSLPVVIKMGAERNMMRVNRTDFVSVEGIIFQGSEGSRGINLMHSRFFQIRECVFADCDEAVSCLSTAAGDEAELWSGFSDCIFLKNKASIVLDDSSRTCIRNNVFIGNEEAALKLYRFQGSIMLNIFSLPRSGAAIEVVGGKKLSSRTTVAKDLDYNCYTGSGCIFVSGNIRVAHVKDWEIHGYEFDRKSVMASPGFGNEAAGDFRLAADSKCRLGLPADMPMGVRWSDQRWQTYLNWRKGRKD